MSFYIINPNDHLNPVWYHRHQKFCIDFDAEYNPKDCGYSSRRYAIKRAEYIMRTLSVPALEVISRQALFEWLEVEDWSRG